MKIAMFRNDIIAQLDAEIDRLERARDFLASAPTSFKTATRTQPKKRLSAIKPKQAKREQPKKTERTPAAVAVVTAVKEVETVVSTPPPLEKEATQTEAIQQSPQVHRVPPRRRFARRPSQRIASSEDSGKSAAALRGTVPLGPVAVSADEARKAQERNAAPPSNQAQEPAPIEMPSTGSSERSLGSLIQAFERSNRSNRIGTP
jgi:hypothetical protein